MTKYEKLGMKSGLEIHQQLDTHKLFCECPSEVLTGNADFTIHRELRPLAGEVGKIDPAALFEKKKRKFYIYEVYDKTTCLVETDEEPPHPLNLEALDIVLLIAKMLHCEYPDVVQVMRKTVVDGSNTSGFQRTALVGTNGWLQTSFGKVGIQTVILEEDSARRTGESPESVTFRLDRLGMPLVEIATDPDCKNPEQVKEVAEKLGSLLRSTGKVIRGLGTIRQDVNVSIKGHPRIEIKGVQDLQNIPQIVEKEVERQSEELKKGGKIEGHVRNVKEDLTTKFLRPMPGASRMYPETDIPLIVLDQKKISELKLPESLESRETKFIKLGLSEDLAKQVVRDVRLKFIEHLLGKFKNANPNAVVSTILSAESEVKRKIGKEIQFSESDFESVLDLLDRDKVVKESVLELFIGLSKGENISELAKKFSKLSDAELKKEIEKIKSANKDIAKERLIGIAMGKLRGKASAEKIIQLLK